MNFNNLANLFNNNSNSEDQNNAEFVSNEKQNEFIPLYPDMPKETQNQQNTNANQTTAQSQNTQNNGNLMGLIQLFSLFNNKKMDLSSLIASPIGKSLGINENMAAVLSLMSNKGKTKVQTNAVKETLPKIDSLERLK